MTDKKQKGKSLTIDPITAKLAPSQPDMLKIRKPAARVEAPTKVEAKRIADNLAIWNSMKDVKIPIFGLKDQKVSDYCEPIELDPKHCYLKIKVSSVIPLLEEAFSEQYNFESAHSYLVVSRKG
jgi:hypothetical protein